MTVVRGWGATICFAEQMSAASGVRFVQGLTGRWRPCEASSSRSARRIARSEIQVVKVGEKSVIAELGRSERQNVRMTLPAR